MKRSLMQARTGFALLLAMVSVAICFAHGADGWEPDSCTKHTCTAGPINAGDVTYGGTTLWRHHNAPYSKGTNSDFDCYYSGTNYSDVAETTYTVDWKVQMYENGQWVDKGIVSGNVTGANWDTTGYAPDYEYRMKSFTNDSAGGGRDDPGVYKYSAGQVLHAPGVTNFHITQATPQTDGVMHFEYQWDSTCGTGATHVAHLDKVRVREYVTYEDTYTSGGIHHLAHLNASNNPANYFTSDVLDPTYGSTNPLEWIFGSDGICVDNHYRASDAGGTPWESYCQSSQKYQWATGWQYAPAPDDNNADWHTLETHTIKRYVELRPDAPTKWRYRFIKDDNDNWRSIHWY